jgi:hypothetical protein
MDKAMADRIKELRCGRIVHSWRRIAEIIVEEYPNDFDPELSGNQILGMELCKDAAISLGEDPGSEDWN